MTNAQKQQRLRDLFAISRQRYLKAGVRPTGHGDGNHYMTPAGKQEFLTIARSLRQQSTATEARQETQAQV